MKRTEKEKHREEKRRGWVLRENSGLSCKGMDQSQLLEAIGLHLQSLQGFTRWLIVIAIVAAYAAAQGQELPLLGLKLSRSHAWWGLFGLNIVTLSAIAVLFYRIGDVLLLLDPKQFLSGVSKLCLHNWVLNPFAHFGGIGISRYHESLGYGGLIFLWFLTLGPIVWLFPFGPGAKLLTAFVFLLCLAYLPRIAIGRIYDIVWFRMSELCPERADALQANVNTRRVFWWLGVVIGLLSWLLPQVL